MMPEQRKRSIGGLDARKKALIEQGAQYRTRVAESRRIVHASLQGEAIARSAFGHLAGNASALLGSVFNLTNASSKPKLLLSLVLGGISLLSRKGLIKPALSGALLLGGVGALVVWWQGKRRRRDSARALAKP